MPRTPFVYYLGEPVELVERKLDWSIGVLARDSKKKRWRFWTDQLTVEPWGEPINSLCARAARIMAVSTL